jgi:hypothetical protein
MSNMAQHSCSRSTILKRDAYTGAADLSGATHSHHSEGPHAPAEPGHKGPAWRRAHRDWRFWVAVFFVFLAIAIYVSSVDLSLVPRVISKPK